MDTKKKDTIDDIAKAVGKEVAKKNVGNLLSRSIRSLLAILCTGSILGFFFYVVSSELLMNLQNKEVLMFILGSMVSLLTMIASYYFRKDSNRDDD